MTELAEVGAHELEAARERYMREREMRPENFDRIARFDTDFVEACLEYSPVPRKREALSPVI